LSEHVGAQVEAGGNMAVSTTAQSAVHHSTDSGESRLVELQNLKKRVADLSKENATLRHELSMAKSKLDQIKKIA
jgi:hypothetical protein